MGDEIVAFFSYSTLTRFSTFVVMSSMLPLSAIGLGYRIYEPHVGTTLPLPLSLEKASGWSVYVCYVSVFADTFSFDGFAVDPTRWAPSQTTAALLHCSKQCLHFFLRFFSSFPFTFCEPLLKTCAYLSIYLFMYRYRYTEVFLALSLFLSPLLHSSLAHSHFPA